MKALSNDYVGDELSHGTMRQEDLIPTFMGFLHDVKVSCGIVAEVNNLQTEVDELELEEKEGYGTYYKNPDDANWILHEDIWELLYDIAPEFTYFGSHEGDGAAYGFWTDVDILREHVQDMLAPIVKDDFPDLGEARNTLMELTDLLDAHI